MTTHRTRRIRLSPHRPRRPRRRRPRPGPRRHRPPRRRPGRGRPTWPTTRSSAPGWSGPPDRTPGDRPWRRRIDHVDGPAELRRTRPLGVIFQAPWRGHVGAGRRARHPLHRSSQLTLRRDRGVRRHASPSTATRWSSEDGQTFVDDRRRTTIDDPRRGRRRPGRPRVPGPACARDPGPGSSVELRRCRPPGRHAGGRHPDRRNDRRDRSRRRAGDAAGRAGVDPRPAGSRHRPTRPREITRCASSSTRCASPGGRRRPARTARPQGGDDRPQFDPHLHRRSRRPRRHPGTGGRGRGDVRIGGDLHRRDELPGGRHDRLRRAATACASPPSAAATSAPAPIPPAGTARCRGGSRGARASSPGRAG